MTATLVLGGIRSGKSALAEKLAQEKDGPVVYVATATIEDVEMQERVRLHRLQRPSQWWLEEEPLALGSVLRRKALMNPVPNLLIDCMSLWVSNLLHAGDDVFNRERDGFLTSLVRYPGEVVIVSNEVGLGIIGMDPLTRRFADELGWLNQALAKRCDKVVLSIAGIAQTLKG
ncbi:bifunctional adenosylcobinamide kinase/adenosylcobinamide-phosphate guanylyltransferase [Alcanivorax sediminis]|uniref:Bifunctional adenosylcobalamin biosynthesis protein n=1 Tax=Alcanivorax sediminis TaxID=2663008 RepID=A0A6N7LWK8_9GAMM|nr:bifunctional adenosylcobinamide kinase/adenosylcobinamide-phosphate guanylyltransferase [Alcanivorax sediminis]MQX52621.1 bifunctional adenosylcobinamide kinase/adenosylcobinamide-phosphate guanylyltransferase [Alcanivorax sediminis]